VRALLVVNPQATSTTAAGRDVLAHALASAVKLEVVETAYRGHAMDLARQATADGMDLVVAHGGDGTVNEVVNGMLDGKPRRGRSAPMLGIVPGGSANVFARALGIPNDPVEATGHLLHAIERGRKRKIGLGRADDRWFTFNAGVGYDAEVVAGVERRRTKQASDLLYARVALTHYARQAVKAPRMRLELPGEEPIEGIRSAFVSNTDQWSYLGDRPLRLNPGCTFQGGLGLFGLRSLATPTMLRLLSQVLRNADPRGGNLVRRDDVEWIRVRCDQPVRLQLDGDLIGERTLVEFTAVANALTVAA
jgi:diacylglycerol kinase family enzyme